MLILHDYDISAECYAVRLLAALIGVPLDLRRLDVYPGRANEAEAFLTLNPLGTVPAMETDEGPLFDWQAILAHLAFRHDPENIWWPREEPRLIEWLGIARALGASAGLARLHDGIGAPADIEACRSAAHRLLRVLERHLWFGERESRAWLLPGDHPTAADVAVFVHVVLCEEGGIDRMDYPAIRRWIDRVRHLHGFVAMSGVFAPMHGVAA